MRDDTWQPVSVAGGPTKGQALGEHPDGMLQVPLGEVQIAEAAVGNDRRVPSAVRHEEAERLLPVAPTLGEGPDVAQDACEPCPGLDLQNGTGRASLPVHRLYGAPHQLGRPAEVAPVFVYSPQVMGSLHLQGALTERGRELEGLVTHRHGILRVSRDPAYMGRPGQHSYQPSLVVERPGQGLSLA